MVMALEELSLNLSKVEASLIYHLIIEQQETNRLLTQLLESKSTVEEAEAVQIDDLKRPELMKRISKTKAPQGWQKWNNDKMIAYLKGDS